MRRLAPFIIFGIVLGIAPVAGPELPMVRLEYIREEPKEATLVAVGDIMLSRTVAKRMREQGFDFPFASTTDLIQSADIAFGNLETAITPGEPVLPFEMSFRADIESARALKNAGFDVLSLANNHTPNFGERGLLDTMQYLDEVDIVHAGAGDATRANQPVFVSIHGIQFAFLAYANPRIVPASYEASDDRIGTAFMDLPRMQGAVVDAKNVADIVIVSMHAGDEYESQPNASQIAFAHAAIDAGAEMVIGHHPHVVQTTEIYKGKHIFYSLGNFIFDQMWSEHTRKGLALKIYIGKTGVTHIEYHPVKIYDYAQPRFIEDAYERQSVIERLSASPSPVDRAETSLDGEVY